MNVRKLIALFFLLWGIVSCPAQTAPADKEVFYDVVDDFADADFWKNYNIIEPTQSLEKAVLKLK